MHRIKLAGLFISIIMILGYGDAAGKGGKKDIERDIDYITVIGKNLKNNINKDISKMSLLASANGKVTTVPFQIDEMSPEGENVLTQVPPGGLADEDLKPEKDSDNGLLDDNDQLVFMIRDSGDRIKNRNDLPAAVESFDEIQLEDPIDNGKAWVYLCSFKENPPLSDEDYIKYQFPQNLLVSKNYVLGFPKEAPVFPGYLTIYGSENIVDRVKLRTDISIMFIPFPVNEENLVSKLSLYKDGPVRTIRRTSTSVRFMGIFRTQYLGIELIAYDKICMIPIRLNIPFNIKNYKSMLKAMLRAGVDFCNVKGWKLKTNANPNWVNLDGKMDETEKAMNGQDLSWFVLTGDDKAFVVRIILNRKPDGSYQETPITPHLYYIDDDKLNDEPENVPGQSPNIQFKLDGFENLSKGYLYFYTIFYIIDNYKDGKEKKYLQILDKPVRAAVNP